MTRRILIGGVGGGMLVLIGLVAAALFWRFPMVLMTGNAHLQRWIGPNAARFSFFGLAIVVGAGAIWVAVQGTRNLATRPAWLLGASAGAGLGLLAVLLYLITSGLATTEASVQVASIIVMLGLLLGPLVVGLVAARNASRTSAGAVAGFWFALLLVICAAIGVIASDTLFASHLLQTAWVNYSSGDALCTNVHGATLMGCAVGDDLGFAATLLIFGPVLGLGLGAFAGLLGHVLTQRLQREATWMATLMPPMIFSMLLALVMVAELVGNLW